MGEGSSILRSSVHRALDPRAAAGRLSAINKGIICLILLAVLLAILETEPTLTRPYGSYFLVAEWAMGGLFATEYLARLWTAPERDPSRPPMQERLRFILSPAGLADLVAIGASLAPVGAGSVMLLRIIRLARIVRLAKLARFSKALDHLSAAIASRRDELLLSLFVSLGLVLVAATLLHLAEGAVQPEKFGSIPRALWWAVATMTTIGYGDVYPITPLGRVMASVVAVFSIGVIAMPTGILAGAFSDAVQRQRSQSTS